MTSVDDKLPVNNMLVIGAGLIGGSLSAAMLQRKLVNTSVGYARRLQPLEEGVRKGFITSYTQDLNNAIAEADLVVLAVPTLTVRDYLERIKTFKKPGAVVTDVASVKGDIVNAVEEVCGSLPDWFVPGHPIAGSEKSGIEASKPELFVNHKVILTPSSSTNPEALELVRKVWESVGAEVIDMSVSEHDKVLAATSHLPHALAFALVDSLNSLETNVDIFRFAAGGFRDFTRIASSHPVMWHDIMKANKSAILDVLSTFKSTLAQLEKAMEDDDGEAILAMFERARDAREYFASLLENQNNIDQN